MFPCFGTLPPDNELISGRRMSIHWADGAPKQLLHAVVVYTAMSILSIDVSTVQVLCQWQDV